MKHRVGILGATGVIGKAYIERLRNHPTFELASVAASEKREHEYFEGFLLGAPDALKDCSVIFSALPSSLAEKYESLYAKAGVYVISSSSFFRSDETTPLIIPEINGHHLNLLSRQQEKKRWTGGILCKPNCSIQSFLLPLAPLHKLFTIRHLSVTMLQSISGAGKSGLSSLDIMDNIIPYIEDEEEKVESEPLKILRDLPPFTISAHCNRVPTLHGHLACVSVSFKAKPKKEEILECWNANSTLDLPSAPKKLVHYTSLENRPQIRLDRDLENGMGITVGRLRPDPISDWRFVALSHNLIRGGAGGGVLIAELLQKEGYLG